MNVFIATWLFFILFLLVNHAYERKSGEFFIIFYGILCVQLSDHTRLNEHPFVDVQSLLAAVCFCLFAQFYEMYLRQAKKITHIFFTTETLSKSFALGGALIYLVSFLFTEEEGVKIPFVFAASGIAYLLIFVIERGFRHWYPQGYQQATADKH